MLGPPATPGSATSAPRRPEPLPEPAGRLPCDQAKARELTRARRGRSRALLEAAAAPFVAARVLAELAEGDFLWLGMDGRISAAYPFSATTTPHRVQIAGGASAYAMCAIDALGIAPMLRTSVVIRSADPTDGGPITVAVDGGDSAWHPAAAVVFAGRPARERPGPSAAICCGYMNFFASSASAAAWARARPQIKGAVLGQARAMEVGKNIFGQLLR